MLSDTSNNTPLKSITNALGQKLTPALMLKPLVLNHSVTQDFFGRRMTTETENINPMLQSTQNLKMEPKSPASGVDHLRLTTNTFKTS